MNQVLLCSMSVIPVVVIPVVTMTAVEYKARQTRFIVSHQRPLLLRPAATFQALTCLLLMVAEL